MVIIPIIANNGKDMFAGNVVVNGIILNKIKRIYSKTCSS